MKARFTGKDSMGIKHGKVYDIYTKVNMIQRRMPVTGEIEYLDCICFIKRMKSKIKVLYIRKNRDIGCCNLIKIVKV